LPGGRVKGRLPDPGAFRQRDRQRELRRRCGPRQVVRGPGPPDRAGLPVTYHDREVPGLPGEVGRRGGEALLLRAAPRPARDGDTDEGTAQEDTTEGRATNPNPVTSRTTPAASTPAAAARRPTGWRRGAVGAPAREPGSTAPPPRPAR
jgi:hypothetical protein